MRWRYGPAQTQEYWFEGAWVNPGLVRHRWDCDSYMPSNPSVTAVPASGWSRCCDDFTQRPREPYLYRLAKADVRPMLERYGHGPAFWTCACDACLCACGLSWHLHPSRYDTDVRPMRASCPRLEGMAELAPEEPEIIGGAE